MRPIFWVLADDVQAEFIPLNKPMIDISKKYPLYAICSGNISAKLFREHYNAVVVEMENDIPQKGRVMLNEIKKRGDYDVLVKLDMDALVMDLDWLLRMLREHVKPMTMVGQVLKNPFSKGNYVRGGCQAVHCTVADKMFIPFAEGKAGRFDYVFSEGAVQAGAAQVNVPLFELNETYQRESPVWHPAKLTSGSSNIAYQLEQFKNVLKSMK